MNQRIPGCVLIGESEPFLTMLERLETITSINRPVLLIGERGTGKELVARRIHYTSGRWDAPLLSVNCAAFSPELLDSELFGHESGAFTGAIRKHIGLFERANGGTLFLDEIGNCPIRMQEKILRVLETGRVLRVGGGGEIETDVRIIAATNVNLKILASRGNFRADLLDRLSFAVIEIPPLRVRKEDIPPLVEHFAISLCAEIGREDAPEFSAETVEMLRAYPWPGNIRELKNVVERAVILSAGRQIEKADIVIDPFAGLDKSLAPEPSGPAKTAPLPQAAEAPEPFTFPLDFNAATLGYQKRMFAAALERTRFNQREAAKLLGMTYSQFRHNLKKHADIET